MAFSSFVTQFPEQMDQILMDLENGNLSLNVRNDTLGKSGQHINTLGTRIFLGIIAAAGACWRLVELVGEPDANEILLAGRVLPADEALSIRLVGEVCEPDELLDRANALADRIGGFDPLAIQVTKQVIHAPRAAHPVIDNLAQGLLFESPEKTRRMDDFLLKRNARKGR